MCVTDRNPRLILVYNKNGNTIFIKTLGAILARSGHRSFMHEEYLYVIGGHNPNLLDKILKDIWRLNTKSKTWEACHVTNLLPSTMTSFSC